MKYLLIMRDTEGNEWASDGFDTIDDAEIEAIAKETADGWETVRIEPYSE